MAQLFSDGSPSFCSADFSEHKNALETEGNGGREETERHFRSSPGNLFEAKCVFDNKMYFLSWKQFFLYYVLFQQCSLRKFETLLADMKVVNVVTTRYTTYGTFLMNSLFVPNQIWKASNLQQLMKWFKVFFDPHE